MRIELTLPDLVRVGLAAAADPMGELAASLQVLQRRDGGRTAASAAFTRWRYRVWQSLPESAAVLMWLCRPGASLPAFLLPAAGRYELESGLAAVLKTDPLSLKTALRTAPAARDLPSWAAALADGDTVVSGAGELRVKESDRIAALEQLRRCGVEMETRPDGLTIHGTAARRLRSTTIDPHGDHRIAMAFAIAGLAAEDGIEIADPGCVDVSFPGFFDCLARLGARVEQA